MHKILVVFMFLDDFKKILIIFISGPLKVLLSIFSTLIRVPTQKKNKKKKGKNIIHCEIDKFIASLKKF